MTFCTCFVYNKKIEDNIDIEQTCTWRNYKVTHGGQKSKLKSDTIYLQASRNEKARIWNLLWTFSTHIIWKLVRSSVDMGAQ
jgi:hypothetical protein